MGVRGLKTFIFENKKQLLKPTKLRDTRLIIDGHGICRILHNNLNPSSDYFGGNYAEFAKLCENFFTGLSDCKIEPYVFFDGVQDEEKIKVTLHRLEERIEWQQQISEGKTLTLNFRMLPILSYETFKTVLMKKNIRHRTCTWESDPQMAAFAVELDCPILTCDSDFFIYDIPKGVIVVDHLGLNNIKKCQKTGNYLEVDIYHTSSLMFQMGLEEEDHRMIALLATVLGNDRMSRLQFQQFFKRAKLPEKFNDLTDTTNKKRVLKTLGWLQSKKKLSVAVSDLIWYHRPEKREEIEKDIMRSIGEYTNATSEAEFKFFSASISASKALSMRSIFEELPKWFVENYRKCKIPVPALAAKIERPVILPPQISVMNKSSPYVCCLSARKFMYRLLFVPEAIRTITEFDRDENCHLKRQDVCLDSLVDGSKSIPSLNEIPDLCDEAKFSILLENLDLPLKLLEIFPKDVDLLIAAIIFWLRNVEPEVNRKRYLYALLACFFRNGKFDSCLNASGAATSHSRFAMLDRFLEVPSEISPSTCDCNVVHVFAQFQCCLQTVIYLSQILLLSPDAIHLVTGFNGTFLHNLYCELCAVELDMEDEVHFMRNLFGRHTKVSRIFNKIGQSIEELL